RFPVGLEEGSDGGAVVHAFTLPGCAGAGRTQAHALDEFQVQLGRWLEFLGGLGEAVPGKDRELEITVDEWIRLDAAVGDGPGYALFEADHAPLSEGEVGRGLQVLGALRARLLPQIRRAKNEDLEVS